MKKVEAHSNLLKCRQYGKCLIKLPKTKFRFWYPQKLVQLSGKNNCLMTIYYTDTTQFYAFRCGNGVHNSYQVIDKIYLISSEWEQYFYQYKIN